MQIQRLKEENTALQSLVQEHEAQRLCADERLERQQEEHRTEVIVPALLCQHHRGVSSDSHVNLYRVVPWVPGVTPLSVPAAGHSCRTQVFSGHLLPRCVLWITLVTTSFVSRSPPSKCSTRLWKRRHHFCNRRPARPIRTSHRCCSVLSLFQALSEPCSPAWRAQSFYCCALHSFSLSMLPISDRG